ncbi:MAG: diguanylate cyclase, partial [Methylococcaceae bacterium]|nr:diguanylate cyclase [Methylococcaceae bacterium]
MVYIKEKKANLLFVIIVLLVAGFMLYSLERNTQRQMELYKQNILQEAIAHFDNMIMTRSWNALYGGVFVKPTNGLKPNPYLKNNSIKDEHGNLLVKINPAWMTR